MAYGWYLMCGEDHEEIIYVQDGYCRESISKSERDSIRRGRPSMLPVIEAAEAADANWTDENERQELLKACVCPPDSDYTFIKLDV